MTDDTVLEEHYENPGLVQMRILGEGGKKREKPQVFSNPGPTLIASSPPLASYICYIMLEKPNYRIRIRQICLFRKIAVLYRDLYPDPLHPHPFHHSWSETLDPCMFRPWFYLKG